MINTNLQESDFHRHISSCLTFTLSKNPQKKMQCPNTKLKRTTQETEALYLPERTTAEQLNDFSHSSHQLHIVA
jgi:hypothetical protein